MESDDPVLKAYWDEDGFEPLPDHFAEKSRAIIDEGGAELYRAWREAGCPWPFNYTTIISGTYPPASV